MRHAKENYQFEQRSLSFDLSLTSLLPQENLPGPKILGLVTTLQLKHLELRHLVVCKLAVNSLDTHYILAKAQEVHKIITDFLTQVKIYIKDSQATQFEDLGSA